MKADDEAIPEYSGKWWSKELTAAEKDLNEMWRDSADKVVARYLDRREDNNDKNTRKYNIFWSNVQILKSALYATPPKPTVQRQNGDAKDDVARTAALILERLLQLGVSKDESDMHQSFKSATENRLIPGMGQVWLRLDIETEPYYLPDDETRYEKIIHEEVICEDVNWRDFIWGAARVWSEVPWVARRIWMKKKDFVEKYGKEKYAEAKGIVSTAKEVDGTLPKGFKKGRIECFEVWCKDTNKVYHVNKILEENLSEEKDPLLLDDFFPCPRPLLATHTTNTLIPRPDYVMCQDQYAELDDLNDRISTLTKALRVVGVYDSTNTELKQLLTGNEFRMIGVSNWAMFAEKGGMKGSVDWFPVEQIATVLEKLMTQRQAVIGQIYELTSISDIMRGSSNPRETAKAQTLKAQYSSVRLQLTQQEVATFVRHAMRIKAEIIARHFQPQTIIDKSQVMLTESAQFATQAVELIKNYEASEYRLEISEESLSIADYNAEREMRTEYLTAIGQFLSQAGTITQGAPGAMPFLLRIIQWTTAAFKGSNDIESVLDEAIALASQPQPPQDDGKAAAEQMKLEAQGQIEQSKQQTQVQIAELNAANAVEVARIKEEAATRIAELNNETKILVQQMTAQLQQVTEENKRLVEESSQDNEKFMQQVDLAHQAISQLNEQAHQREQTAAEREAQAKQEMEATLGEFRKPKKRIRVPTYDDEGRIVKIEDTEEES